MVQKILLLGMGWLPVLGGAAASDGADGARTYTLSIEAQPLDAALNALATQSGLQIVFYSAVGEGVTSPRLVGTYTLQTALKELLVQTRLHAEFINPRTVAIRAEQDSVSLSTDGAGEESRPYLRLAQADAQASQADELEVVVTAAPYRFLDADTSGTTNLPLPIEQVPQSITLLSADFMQVAGINSMKDFDRYIAGVSSGGVQGGFFSKEKIRGFLTGQLYSRYVDGLQVAGFNFPEFAFFERVEVVKGPSSVTYGIATPGGLYNFVSKRAPKTYAARVSGEVGSWNSFRTEAEVGGPLNSEGTWRGVGMVVRDTGDSFTHHADHEDSGAYVGLEYAGTGKVSGAVNARFSKHAATIMPGILFYPDGRRPDVPRGFYMGDPERNLTDTEYGLLSGNLNYAATDSLDISFKANYQDISREVFQVVARGLSDDGNYQIAGYTDPRTDWKSYAGSLNATYRFRFRDMEGSFLSASATYTHFAYDVLEYGLDYHGPENTVANLSEGEQGLYEKIRRFTVLTDSPSRFYNEMNIKLLTAQSVVRMTERLSLLSGYSISEPSVRTGSPRVTTDYGRQSSLRGGLMYEFRPKSNLYVSYSESFEPNPPYLLDINDELLPPLEGSQWEAGLKSRQFNGMLLLTAAAFRIEQKNTPALIGQHPGGREYYGTVGEVRHEGLELEAMGLVTPSLTLSAAAAYLNPKVTADVNEALVGESRPFLPRQTASVFLIKNFESGILHGFNVGGGARYIGNRKTSFNDASRDLPAYTVVDLSAGYKAERWSAQLSLNNVFDKFYVQANSADTFLFGNTIGEPFNARLRVTWNFGSAQH